MKRVILKNMARGLALAGLLAAAMPVAAGEDSGRRPDGAILKDVEKAILGYPYYTVFDSVSVGVQEGLVSMQGSVKEPYRKDDIEGRVAKIPGIRSVESEIRVQPLSFGDDRLRLELLRKIYGNGAFIHFASWANPPVRIVVENGHVTLTGYVNGQVDRQMIGAIARGTLAFSVDNQLKLDSEAEAVRSGE